MKWTRFVSCYCSSVACSLIERNWSSRTWLCDSSLPHFGTSRNGRGCEGEIGSFWAILSGIWKIWRSALLIVQPDTVIRWHRTGFRLFWRWKSRSGKVGRPKTDLEIRRLIRRMSRENPSWGVPRIQSELALSGHTVSEATARKYRIRKRNPPSQTWWTFLDNHLTDIVAIDFFTVPTATFRILFALW